MKRFLTTLAFMLFTAATLFAQQTDEQVIQLLKECNEKEMSQTQTMALLTSKGVTMEQLKRLKAQYDNGTLTMETKNSDDEQTTKSKNAAKNVRKMNDPEFTSDSMLLTTEQRTLRRQKEAQQKQMQQLKQLQAQLKDLEQQIAKSDTMTLKIFGRDVFQNPRLDFSPNYNMPTPDNYVLGSGDEINIVIWGSTEMTANKTLSPEGRISLNGAGLISLNGLTVKQANARLRQELGRIYGGLNSGEAQLKVTLGNIRSIQVHVMGEVEVPGTYTLPSLATVFHSLYSAQGINALGSLRNIRVVRNNKTVGEVDIYRFLLTGNKEGDIVLQDGDVVIVPPYQQMATIRGGVKRPMKYEMREGENLADLVEYAGGFLNDAYRSAMTVVRQNESKLEVFNVEKSDYADFKMEDGDKVTAGTMLTRYDNKVEVEGAVFKDGTYAIDATVKTVGDLVKAAQGIREDAFTDRVLLTREKEDWTKEMISLDLGKLLRGEIADVPLRKNDVLLIPSKHDLQEKFYVSIQGPVADPGNYQYAEGMTVEDLVIRAGGLKESAATVKVDVSRRIKDPKSTSYGQQRSEVFTVSLSNGLVSGDNGFRLDPYDQVYIRKSPIYNRQNAVTVEGEVLFGGSYSLEGRLVRVSEVIAKAGGVTPYAYVEGARLERTYTDEDRERANRTARVMAQQMTKRDSVSIQLLNMDIQSYPVGFDLTKAMKNPGSTSDIILQAGDRIVIPEYDGTVRISGAVMYPNAVVFQSKMKLRDYVKQAGGFGTNSRPSKVIVIYRNGTVTTGKCAKIRPGCEILVPMKSQNKRMNLQEIMGLTSTTASLAAVVASMGALFK